ncbi:MarR family winged helix-turn-helix transcriptional regulator [Patulibacter sp.]|uniref:MarR family winged helix-turn-helix transcriptional regulator n=1 Tax=Patulibacter sp. TaxID=1912859 RepID=UPI0027274200|nr:MarR family winged helix-turn-helix transcriptional regulator [Patulibacter sp.]MDO9407732.1 MarR family winged helix-turn-helix transcriptional regulator [Patulibacter sp.]
MADPAPRGRAGRPTATELEAWRLFIETSIAVKARIDRAIQTDSGLSAGDYAVLLALAEADDRWLRTTELATTVFWERSRLSHQITRMCARGLVRREPSVRDQRGTEVHLTPEGLAALRAASGPHLRTVKEVFVDALDADRQAEVAAAMRTLAAHLERLDAGDGAADAGA